MVHGAVASVVNTEPATRQYKMDGDDFLYNDLLELVTRSVERLKWPGTPFVIRGQSTWLSLAIT